MPLAALVAVAVELVVAAGAEVLVVVAFDALVVDDGAGVVAPATVAGSDATHTRASAPNARRPNFESTTVEQAYSGALAHHRSSTTVFTAERQ